MAEKLRIMTFLAPNLEPLYAFVAEHVGRVLGLETEWVVGSEYEQAARGEADAAFICGLPYVMLNRQHPPPLEALAAPVLSGERYKGEPIYFSDVIVRRDTPFNSFEELRGCTWVYNEPLSQSGYGIVREKLRQLGETAGFFGQVLESGWHQRSMRMVASGEVDASAIDSHVLAVELRDHPELADKLRAIDALGPSTIQPFAVSVAMPEGLKKDLRAVLMEMGDWPEARAEFDRGLVLGFASVEDASYDEIRAMLEAAEQAGFMEIR